jgi:hypothetical protein
MSSPFSPRELLLKLSGELLLKLSGELLLKLSGELLLELSREQLSFSELLDEALNQGNPSS